MRDPLSTVMTVRGPVAAHELGVTLPHEHILCDLQRDNWSDGVLHNVLLAVHELNLFRALGGGAVMDTTNRSLGQQPLALRAISEQTGLHIVLGCGLYRQQYYDRDWVDRTSTDALADLMVRDLTEGIDDSGICAGFIGEVACNDWISAQEERNFRAAARAHRRTGATISTHAFRAPVGLAQLDLLAAEGANLHKVIIGHSDTVFAAEWRALSEVLGYHEALARRGAYVQFDVIRPGSELELDRRVRFVVHLAERGFLDRVLLSQDIWRPSLLKSNGGGGYGFVLEGFVPRLRQAGLSTADIQTILVDNPRRALTTGSVA